MGVHYGSCPMPRILPALSVDPFSNPVRKELQIPRHEDAQPIVTGNVNLNQIRSSNYKAQRLSKHN